MVKLTEAQRRALKILSECSGKSGAFYRDLDVHATSLHSLERDGLAESFGHWRPRARQWRITDLGRQALSSNRRGE
jgi:hypothetical protein